MSEKSQPASITTLHNGLRVASYKMDDYIQTVTISIGVYVGSRNENEDENGISHFLEHMAFKGTEKRTYLQIAKEIEDIGGYMNAFTSKEKTVYYVKVLKEDLEKGVDILSDIMQNSIFDKEEIEKERGVILQELSSSIDTPDDIIYDYFMETAFPSQPIGRAILGSEETIKSFKKQDFVNYITSKYNASNMVLSAAGNVDHEKFTALADKYFTKLKNGSSVVKKPAKYEGGFLAKENKNLSQVQFTMGFKTCSYNNDDKYKLSVLNTILLGGMSARLFEEVREKQGLVYTISDFSSQFSDCGVFGIYAGTSPENLEKLTQAICKELKRATTDITTEELETTLAKVKASKLMSLESTTSISHKLISDLLIFEREIPFKEVLSKYQSITVEQIQQFLSEILEKKDLTISVYGKTDKMPSLQTVKDMLS
jgi:predicted Zn-dependent peptidase